MRSIQLSFVIPAKNEAESVKILYYEIVNVVEPMEKLFEIVFVDDGSTDQTYSVISKLSQEDARVKAVRLRGNLGKSTALQTGFDLSRGEIIFTLDGDLQDDPHEIPSFLQKLDEGFDLVSGWKKVRHDPSVGKVIPSRIVNFLTRKLTGLPIHDTNCGFKAYRREVIENLNLYGELYRFIPVIAARQKFKIAEVVVNHRARQYGKTKYGWGRGIKGMLDLLTIIFLTGYAKRPGHFFGTLGLASFLVGFVVGLYITYLRVTTGSVQYRYPLLFFGMLMMIIGVQLISTGLLAEMITFYSQKRDSLKTIRETSNVDF